MDRGAYTWAKYGFKVDDPEYLASSLARELRHAYSEEELEERVLNQSPDEPTPPPRPGDYLTEEQSTQVEAIIAAHADDPELPWHVAGIVLDGHPVGKDLLYNQNWNGTLDLRDKEATDRLEALRGGLLMAEKPLVLEPPTDMYSVLPSGTKSNAWIMDELFGEG